MVKTILTVCLNPTLQRTLLFDTLRKGEVNRAVAGRLDASGKGVNVSRVIDQYGDSSIRSRHLTHGSGDGAGLFSSLCRKDDLLLTLVEGGGVRTCTTGIDKSDRTVTELIEPAEPVAAGTLSEIKAALASLLPQASLLVLSGSVAPGYPEDIFAHFCQAAAKATVPVLADFRGKMLLEALRFRPSVVKINLQEFVRTFHLTDHLTDEDTISEQGDDTYLLPLVEAKLKDLSIRYGTTFVLSRGGRESLSYDQDAGALQLWPVHSVDAVNTIGCGDSFTAGLAISMVNGNDLSDGILLGHELAAKNAVLLKPGALWE
jgi:fructose-1-phosphate kinase PfkB-like protein